MKYSRYDLLNIIGSYRRIGYRDELLGKIGDRFGLWGTRLYKLPKETDSTLEDCAVERARELTNASILWSGGIDSTFIVCAFIKANMPFRVVFNDTAISDNPLFYEYLKRHADLCHFKDITRAYTINNLVHGDLADLLFSPDKGRGLELKTSFYENLNDDRLYNEVLEYGKLLKKPTDTNAEIIRLLNFGTTYLHIRDSLNFTLFPLKKITAFFDTEEFNNIAYTDYWYRTVDDEKPEMRRFICSVTDDDRYMFYLHRRPTKIKERLKLTKDIVKKYSLKYK